ncbi:hypothetical protein B0T21DRAFT_117192 [Apiosordaria backusii]|uniref:Secreted protein n=1 Tax=Apiosordaria backusii TaxID=314023 RepID=A0AA40ELQ0_9PEZI|nr:hypothetical protein B0T21DRAFT_117192 [Apiosordaria backusii]
MKFLVSICSCSLLCVIVMWCCAWLSVCPQSIGVVDVFLVDKLSVVIGVVLDITSDRIAFDFSCAPGYLTGTSHSPPFLLATDHRSRPFVLMPNTEKKIYNLENAVVLCPHRSWPFRCLRLDWPVHHTSIALSFSPSLP